MLNWRSGGGRRLFGGGSGFGCCAYSRGNTASLVLLSMAGDDTNDAGNIKEDNTNDTSDVKKVGIALCVYIYRYISIYLYR